jgi:uncharacterized protein YqgV (UPF0045/DUF77 family)
MALDPRRTVNVSVQVLPLMDDPFPVVDRAIAVLAAGGLRYEVGPMDTVLEGPLDEALALARAAHLACLEAGAPRLVTVIKIGDAPGGTTIEEKVARYRQK